MVKRAPVFADVAPQWLDFVSDSVLVAHNAPFDTSFLNHEISRVYPGHRMVNPHLCTVRLSRRALPDLSNHRLDTIANHFSIPIVSRHRAGSDALATAEIFLRVLTEARRNSRYQRSGSREKFSVSGTRTTARSANSDFASPSLARHLLIRTLA